MKCYLAGPISHLTYDDSESWRDEFKVMVDPRIECFSPLRRKQFLRDKGVLEQSYASISPLASDRGIMQRDHFDCARADLIVCNLLGTTVKSTGTIMEIAWAFAYRKPLVLIMEDGNCHDHPMIREAISFRVKDVGEAVRLTEAILIP